MKGIAMKESNSFTAMCDRELQYEMFASFFLDLPSADKLVIMASEAKGMEVGGSAGLEELGGFFARLETCDCDAVLQEVGVDRTFLVRGTTKNGPKPPYGSLYQGTLSEKSMLALKHFYRRAGLELSECVHEAPDYLGVELAFMATLLERAQSFSGSDEERAGACFHQAQEFLADHLAPLAKSYVAEALPYARTGFCRGMLLLLDEFMESELLEIDGSGERSCRSCSFLGEERA